MSDRRAVTAGRIAAPSVAGEMWRVAVGGNRVENMTVEEIAHAYHSGHLTVRTPLWPPGTSGWQALGNFEQFQYAPGAHDAMVNDPYRGQYPGDGQYPQAGLSQFQEGDDDPTRMWTGAGDLEIDMPAPMPVAAPVRMPSAPPSARPSARTGPRQVPSQAPRPMAPPSTHVQRAVSSAPTASPSVPPFRGRRSSGWLLVAGLVGLVGLGSAVLAARGNWTSAAMARLTSSSSETTAAAAPAAAAESNAAPAPTTPEPAPATAAAPSAAAEGAPTVNGVAKYEESGASAFVAGAEPAKSDDAVQGDKPADTAAADDSEDEEPVASKSSKSRRSRAGKESGSKAQPAPKRSLSSKSTSTQNAKRATAALTAKSKSEASESDEAAPPASSSPASPSVNEAAAAALANSAKLASSCRPRGGPSGAGKARIIYSQDGEVQSVEILTAKFRDTLTGSCVRMVFRRAKIPPFKGEPPTFIKSFTIPEE